ncbi:crotonobetainyl-CoA:carnitine CoA-transferase CaiB-like acyl-CoA transferase [Saccharomonospora amisosensis]|uniref:Crotonobetainyl-CoA:carnitine CoA-transferase CaiB-like acyl-CoA transferase n=1 Tax=Saccharomonospora amisosensis TaxID=1128677 RepID=A0A7X5ZTA4_9PSEU|nr:hypothetical protein [Saccharomonospora amisosensis]NIJ14814.1 crotonobetainyl-CoA:carnitine CoA-transferase CaiB-like acyl-CoA transferase [Saccharomonospora amisosensis]
MGYRHGLHLAVGPLAAERRRSRTGEGTRLTVSLHDVALATAGDLGYLAEAQLSEQPRQRIGTDVYGDFGRDSPPATALASCCSHRHLPRAGHADRVRWQAKARGARSATR